MGNSASRVQDRERQIREADNFYYINLKRASAMDRHHPKLDRVKPRQAKGLE